MRVCAKCVDGDCPDCQRYLEERATGKRPEPIELKLGDKVLWKFGAGPTMAIVGMAGKEYICAWFSLDKRFCTQVFPRHHLRYTDEAEDHKRRIKEVLQTEG